MNNRKKRQSVFFDLQERLPLNILTRSYSVHKIYIMLYTVKFSIYQCIKLYGVPGVLYTKLGDKGFLTAILKVEI